VDLGHGQVTKWRKSSFSFGDGDCVEVPGLPSDHVAVRDSKDPEGPPLPFTPDDWHAFLDAVNSREFDSSCDPVCSSRTPAAEGDLWHGLRPVMESGWASTFTAAANCPLWRSRSGPSAAATRLLTELGYPAVPEKVAARLEY
jgi:hypothetical protein